MLLDNLYVFAFRDENEFVKGFFDMSYDVGGEVGGFVFFYMIHYVSQNLFQTTFFDVIIRFFFYF